jgi:hypothetical protein
VYYVTEYIIRNLTLFRGCKKNSDFVEQRQWGQVFAPEEKLQIGGKIKKKQRTKVVDIVTRRTRLTFFPVSGMSHALSLRIQAASEMNNVKWIL